MFEKLKNKLADINKKRALLFAALILLIALFYLSFLPVISPDSSAYYLLSNILDGDVSYSQWWQLRGPTLPAVISLIVRIFGDNPTGFLIGTFMFFLIMIICIFVITKKIADKFDNKPAKIVTYFLVVLLLIFNPVIIGYYHAMLTEFVATTVAIISCFMAYKWVDISFEKKFYVKYIIFTLTFGLLIGSMWLLKQPYVTVAALPFLIASVISIIKNSRLLNIISKVLAIIIAAVFAFLIISSWSSFLCTKIACVTNVRGADTSSYFSKGLINGVSLIREVKNADYLSDVISSGSDLLNDDEREIINEVNNDDGDYKYYEVYSVIGDDDQISDLMIAPSASKFGPLSTQESATFLTQVLTTHPLVSFKSYVMNYLASIDVIPFAIDGIHYYPVASNFFQNGGENYSLSYASFIERPIYWWPEGELPDDSTLLARYEVVNKPNFVAYSIFYLMKIPYLLLFMFTFLLLPILFVVFLIKSIKHRKQKTGLNELLLILFGFSLFNLIFHVLTGAIIDRYASVGYPAALLGIILFIGNSIKLKQIKESVVSTSVSDKLLFVIPAYNEELNIGSVIKDINKNIPRADIVVINDCSKDKTREVVENLGVKCITMPFNVRYAMAVQTGIKYARDNNYGYVVQFDADGQHLAKEAKKLFEEIKKSDNDIVIGSRFVKKTGYKHSWPRMLGTKIFSGMVKTFTGKRITDPTSGLQCLNRRVIEKYARMGEYPEFPDANLIIDMLLKGYKISEVGVEMKQRENGESMHGGIIKPIKYMAKMIYTIFVIVINNLEFKKGDK